MIFGTFQALALRLQRSAALCEDSEGPSSVETMDAIFREPETSSEERRVEVLESQKWTVSDAEIRSLWNAFRGCSVDDPSMVGIDPQYGFVNVGILYYATEVCRWVPAVTGAESGGYCRMLSQHLIDFPAPLRL